MTRETADNSADEKKRPAILQKNIESSCQSGSNMAAMGQLAAGIAHEINTPAQYVSDNIHFLRDAFDGFLSALGRYQLFCQSVKSGTATSDMFRELQEALEGMDMAYLIEEVPQAIQQSLQGMERITQIIEAIRDFSHPGLMEKKAVDINQAIRNTVTVTRNIWKYACEMETVLYENMPRVFCQPGEINQVILNLIVNAADAIKEVIGDKPHKKGIIRISTEPVDGWAEIRISDTGRGIPEPIQGKIFDSFFTTKPLGKGTGQGLALCAAVMANHGGAIEFVTRQEIGTTFIIRLPLENRP
ncbi:MAG: ATP-binding protein [Pseudomonadota bacterium]